MKTEHKETIIFTVYKDTLTVKQNAYNHKKVMEKLASLNINFKILVEGEEKQCFMVPADNEKIIKALCKLYCQNTILFCIKCEHYENSFESWLVNPNGHLKNFSIYENCFIGLLKINKNNKIKVK